MNERRLYLYEDGPLRARCVADTTGDQHNVLDVWCSRPEPICGQGDHNFRAWFEPLLCELSEDRPLAVRTLLGGIEYIHYYFPSGEPEAPTDSNENTKT